MKKFMMFALVLTMILGLSGVMMAQELDYGTNCWPKPTPKCLVGTVKITADVPFYADVKVSETNLELDLPKGPCYGDGAKASGNVNFTIRTNAAADVKGELDGLKYTYWKNWFEGEVNRIPTTAKISHVKTYNSTLWMTLSSTGNATRTVSLPEVGYISGRGNREFKADIVGQLGQIEDQAMGEYKGQLKLTVLIP